MSGMDRMCCWISGARRSRPDLGHAGPGEAFSAGGLGLTGSLTSVDQPTARVFACAVPLLSRPRLGC